jgi:hypothetical protein
MQAMSVAKTRTAKVNTRFPLTLISNGPPCHFPTGPDCLQAGIAVCLLSGLPLREVCNYPIDLPEKL